MIWVMVAIGFFFLLWAFFGPLPWEKEKKPHEREWGAGKDLSELLRPLPISELEQWWQETQSKDAQIQRLENSLRAAQIRAEQYQRIAIESRKERLMNSSLPNRHRSSYLDSLIGEFERKQLQYPRLEPFVAPKNPPDTGWIEMEDQW